MTKMTSKCHQNDAQILLLARNPDHLEELLMNETLLGVLSRLYGEDTRKSIDLTTNIAYIFYSFSVYSKFHSMISQKRVGAITFKIIEHESQRTVLCVKEIADLEKQLGQVLGSGSKKEEVLQKKLKKMKSLTRKQDKLLTVSFHILLNLAEDTKVEKTNAHSETCATRRGKAEGLREDVSVRKACA